MLSSRLIQAVRLIANMKLAEREITVYEDDVFIVSYPKSGNTWARFLVANLMYPDKDVRFSSIESIIPDIYKRTDSYIRKINRPRFLKSHEYFDPRYKKVIYLVRDPRAIAVSYYYYHIKHNKIGEHYPLSEYIDDYLSGKLNQFGNWAENVGSWLGARSESRKFLLLKYEDMQLDTGKELQRISEFLLGEQNDPGTVQSIVDKCGFENMKGMEIRDADVWEDSSLGRKDIPFIREGASEGWRAVLTTDETRKIEAAWGGLMKTFGYK